MSLCTNNCLFATQVNGHSFPPPHPDPVVMPAGITSIDLSTGVVVTNFGVVVQFNGVHEGHIWIPMVYYNCVEGKHRDLYDNKECRNTSVSSKYLDRLKTMCTHCQTGKFIVEVCIVWGLPIHSR